MRLFAFAAAIGIVQGAWAAVPSCAPGGAPVAEHGVTFAQAREGRPEPAPGSGPEFPTPRRATALPVSFWDVVPDAFFVEVGLSRTAVEAFDGSDWARMVARLDAVRDARARGLDAAGATASAWRAIDRLFEEAGLDAPASFDPPPPGAWVVAATIPSEMDAGRAWLMVAALYLEGRHLATARPGFGTPLLGPDRLTARFPSTTAWNVDVERRRLRELACNDPATKAAILRGGNDAALDAAIGAKLSDFDRFAAELAPGRPERAQFLSLVSGAANRARIQALLERDGAAKAYVTLRERAASSRPANTAWDHLRPEEKFLWPQPCLDAFRFEPWLAPWTGCSPERAEVPRERLLRSFTTN